MRPFVSRPLAGVAMACLVAGCQRPQAAPGDHVAVAGQATPTEQPPANVSHGEAPIGADTSSPPVDPAAPAQAHERTHRVRFEMRHVTITIARIAITKTATPSNG